MKTRTNGATFLGQSNCQVQYSKGLELTGCIEPTIFQYLYLRIIGIEQFAAKSKNYSKSWKIYNQVAAIQRFKFRKSFFFETYADSEYKFLHNTMLRMKQ